MFLSPLLTNCETWHGLKAAHINQLETVDKLLLRKIFKTPISTPSESMYLELGILRVGTIIKARRINFLHYLLNRSVTEMISQIFCVQWNHPVKNDWSNFVKQDLSDFKIETNLSEIKNKSVMSFKDLVKKKAVEYEYNQLMKLKQTHSKVNNLCYTKLELQDYLKLETVNVVEAQTLFRYRVRMANYGENFRGKENTILCPLCSTHLDSQKMCFENCPVLRQKITVSGSYHQIFNTNVPREVVKTLCMIDKVREEELSQKEANSTRQLSSSMGASDNLSNYE